VTDRPFLPRRPPDDRSYPPRPPYRPPMPTPRPNVESAPTTSSVRLKDGEREIEVSGTPIFVRQVLDDLPTLLARLRGETPPTPAAIRMPAPTAGQPPAAHPSAPEVHAPAPAPPPPSPAPEEPPITPEVPVVAAAASDAAVDGDGISLEEQVLAALRGAAHPLPVVGIRDRLGPGVSGQQVRRILERAGSKVVASGDRPIRYRLRKG
jgi:hypothetical protein